MRKGQHYQLYLNDREGFRLKLRLTKWHIFLTDDTGDNDVRI